MAGLTAPTFVAAGTPAGAAGNITPGLPAGLAALDVMLLLVETANQAITPPEGWQQLAISPQGGGAAGGVASASLAVLWKRAVDGEQAPTIVNPGDHVGGIILAFRGCRRALTPIGASAGDAAASAQAVTIPGLITPVPQCMIVACVANGTDTAVAQASGWANASLASITERADGNHAAGNGGGISAATGVKVSAGTVAATTATLVTASVQGRICVALLPILQFSDPRGQRMPAMIGAII